MKILITGATGFVGRALWPILLEAGHGLVVLARDASRARAAIPAATVHEWNGVIGLPPAEAFDGVEAIINLIGESVAQRWNPERKRRFRDSRVLATRALVERLGTLTERPRILISMAGVGIYGDRKDEVLTEKSVAGAGFLATLGKEWEAAASSARDLGLRVVILRSGAVLGEGGGIMGKLLPIFRLGLGGKFGSGEQHLPWIHLVDLTRLIVHSLTASDLDGPVNAVAPEPVTNAEFVRALAKTLHRPCAMTVPALALRLTMGEMAEEVLLSSQNVSPIRALESHFEFRFSLLNAALNNLVGEPASS